MSNLIAKGENINGQNVIIVEPTGKTIREWLNELPEPYKSEALMILRQNRAGGLANELQEAIISGLDWNDVICKIDWSKVFTDLVIEKKMPSTVPYLNTQTKRTINWANHEGEKPIFEGNITVIEQPTEPTQLDRIEAKLTEILALLKPKSIDPSLHTME